MNAARDFYEKLGTQNDNPFRGNTREFWAWRVAQTAIAIVFLSGLKECHPLAWRLKAEELRTAADYIEFLEES